MERKNEEGTGAVNFLKTLFAVDKPPLVRSASRPDKLPQLLQSSGSLCPLCMASCLRRFGVGHLEMLPERS